MSPVVESVCGHLAQLTIVTDNDQDDRWIQVYPSHVWNIVCGWRTHRKLESAQPALTARRVYGLDHLKCKPSKLHTILGDHHSFIKYTEKTGSDS